MNKRTIILISIIITMLVIITSIVIIKTNRNNPNNLQDMPKYDIHDATMIEEIKENTNAKADTEMYEIIEEYDGRKLVQIRPNIQFETVLAGIIKNNKPEEDEIYKLIEKIPPKNGIWISEQSRNSFLKLLRENNIVQFEIDDEGYLQSKEKSSSDQYEKINNLINNGKLYIIDISGKCYIRDDFTGEIVEYPFEEMDPDQVVEVYNNENNKIIEITRNLSNKITEQEILTDVLLNLE